MAGKGGAAFKSEIDGVSVWQQQIHVTLLMQGARCSSVVRAFAHGAMGRRIDPSWGGVRCSSVERAFAHGAMGRWIDPSWGGARCSSVV